MSRRARTYLAARVTSVLLDWWEDWTEIEAQKRVPRRLIEAFSSRDRETFLAHFVDESTEH